MSGSCQSVSLFVRSGLDSKLTCRLTSIGILVRRRLYIKSAPSLFHHRHMATWISGNIDSGNGLLPGGTKPLPEPTLTYQPARSNDNNPREISQQIPQPTITKYILKITCLKFHSNIPWANELMHVHTTEIGIADHLHWTTGITPQRTSNTVGPHMEFHHHDPV